MTEVLTNFLHSIPPSRLKLFDEKFSKFVKSTNPDYFGEIVSVAAVTGLSVEEAIAVDFICEITCGCTSVIARAESTDGSKRMVHGRNLDYPVTPLKM